MKTQIKLYRVVLNILFYIFYVLLTSVAFSFIFPTILVILGQDVLSPNNPIFDNIQIAIFIIVLLFSLIFRKNFYLPIRSNISTYNVEEKKIEKKDEIKDAKVVEKEIKKEEIKEDKVEIKNEPKIEIVMDDKIIEMKRNVIRIKDDNEVIDNGPTLDIKIGKEIK